MNLDQLSSLRHELKEVIESLVLDFRKNESEIDRRRFQYGKALKDYYNTLDYETLATTVLNDLTEYSLYISSFTSNMPFMVFNAQQQMLSALQAIGKQEQDELNLAVSIMPGSGKSTMLSYFISWAFARNPDIAFMYLANKEFRAKEQSSKSRAIIMSDPWIRISGVEIGKGKGSESSKLKWSLHSGTPSSGFEAGSHGNILGGNGGNPNTSGFKGGVICDDFQSQNAMTQEYERKSDIEAYLGPVKSRRRNTAIPLIINAQRLHREDLIGYIWDNERKDYKFVSIPSLIKNGDKWASADPRAISVEALLEMRDKNPIQFYAMYQQSPIAAGGAKFKEEWIRTYATLPPKEKWTLQFVTTDFAYRKGEDSDRSVFCIWILAEGYLYLAKVMLGRWDFAEAKERFIKFWAIARRDFDAQFASIEKVKDTLLFKDDLIKMDPSLVWQEIMRGSVQNKVARANDTVPYIASGRILLPEGHSDLELMKGELLGFADDLTHAHDDFCDALFDGCNVAFGKWNMNSLWI